MKDDSWFMKDYGRIMQDEIMGAKFWSVSSCAQSQDPNALQLVVRIARRETHCKRRKNRKINYGVLIFAVLGRIINCRGKWPDIKL
ncbi:MAG TPA: hypothetical protein PKD17_04110 [Cellvibrionaceae bacterium]|nr:hypothetical protein [Cellvibrionaceae bacterium]